MQRRVYDALNVLSAMDIIRKEKNQIFYNPKNEHIKGSSSLGGNREEDLDDLPEEMITKKKLLNLKK